MSSISTAAWRLGRRSSCLPTTTALPEPFPHSSCRLASLLPTQTGPTRPAFTEANKMVKPSCPAYLRLQADRCQRLSRSCMDLGTARDLRLMAEEYFMEASRIETEASS